jgi:hypothetical protein
LVEAYQTRFVVSPRQFFNTAIVRIRHLRSLLAGHQWSTSLAIDQNVGLAYQASRKLLYETLLSEYSPRKKVGIFSGDRIQGMGGLKHYSNVATCIRAILPFSSLRISVLDHALLALLALYYGRLHAEPGLVELAHSCYTSALGQYSRILEQFLSKDTRNSTQAYQVFTCISIALQMFEILREPATQIKEHQPHVHGALNALQSCGPQLLQTSLDLRAAFRGLRGMAVFVAIEQRELTFLAEPDWLNVSLEDVGKTMRDQLNDIGLQIPALLKRFDELAADITLQSAPRGAECGMQLLITIADLQGRLEGWLEAFKNTTPEPLYWSRNLPISHANNNNDLECVPKDSSKDHQLYFLSGSVAGLLVHHWSFVLQLSMTSIELQRILLSHSDQLAVQLPVREILSQGLQREQALADSTAKCILAAEPYLSSCFEGLICLHWPLQIIARYFHSLETL